MTAPTAKSTTNQAPGDSESHELGGFPTAHKDEAAPRAHGADEEAQEQAAQRAQRDGRAVVADVNLDLMANRVAPVPPVVSDIQAEVVLEDISGQRQPGADETPWFHQDPRTLTGGQGDSTQGEQPQEEQPEEEVPVDMSPEEIQALLGRINEARKGELSHLLGRIQEPDTALSRFKSGRVWDAYKLLTGVEKRGEPLPMQNEKMKKITDGAKEYIGGDIRKIGKIKEVVESAKTLASKQGENREATAWAYALGWSEGMIKGELPIAARNAETALAQQIALVEQTQKNPGQASEEQVQAQREELKRLQNEVAIYSRALEIKKANPEMFRIDEVEQGESPLTQAGKDKLVAVEGDMTRLKEELTVLGEEFNTKSKEIAEDPQGNKEFKEFIHELPYVLDANPELAKQAGILFDEIKKRKYKELGTSVYLNLLLYLLGISYQQLDEGLAA